MTSKNAHITEFLNYYCDLNKAPEYAVMLTGLWGSGKTWFIETFIDELKAPERALYISLYGMQSLDSIDAEIFRQVHPILGSKGMRFAGKLLKGVVKTTIHVDLDEDGTSDGSVSASVPSDKLFEKIALDETRILVIDDIERCSIPIEDVLGYINQYVEHGGIKAILLANEKEIASTEGTRSDYKRIKEKLIGHSFEIVPEVSLALEHFASELPSRKVQQIVRKHFDLISKVHSRSEYQNLRLVRNALWDFDRLFQTLDSKIQEKSELVSDLLGVFLVLGIEIKSGGLGIADLQHFKDGGVSAELYRLRNEQYPHQAIADRRKLYSGLNLQFQLVNIDIWETIFHKGAIPQPALNEALRQSRYFLDENQPTWIKLWHWRDLPDHEFPLVLKQAEEEWREFHFTEIGEVKHLVGIFIDLIECGLKSGTATEVVKAGEKYLDHLEEAGLITPVDPRRSRLSPSGESYAQFGYASLKHPSFQEFAEHCEARLAKVNISSLPALAAELLKLMGEDLNLFIARLILSNEPENRYFDTPILQHIDPSDFVQRWAGIEPSQRRFVSYMFEERYAPHRFKEALRCEIPWLESVQEELRAEAKIRAGTPSAVVLNNMADVTLEKALEGMRK